MTKPSDSDRRRLLQALALAPFLGFGALARCRPNGNPTVSAATTTKRQRQTADDRKFLIVVGAAGGASIIDSFMAVRASESAAAATLNTFPDAAVVNVLGSPFRAVQTPNATHLGAIPLAFSADQAAFVNKHKQDMLVVATTGTSVNHPIAQKRSLTGNGAWRGRTLQECVALQHGDGLALPNVNMASNGFQERGTDDELPSACYGETVANATLWHLGLSATVGLERPIAATYVEKARALRDGKLDPESIFARTFAASPVLKRWAETRAAAHAVEPDGLISKLNIVDDVYPTAASGIGTSPDATLLKQKFPNHAVDPFEAQAALAFLLLKQRVSVAVSLSPSFNALTLGSTVVNPPLAFDYCHNDHRNTQAYMWKRILDVIDKLVDLLKAEPYGSAGQSMWDRTLIYVATDFGRTRPRPSNAVSFGSGHDLNNGSLLLSPMLNGNHVLGGVDPATTLTYGFDPETGAAKLPAATETNEKDVFAGILHALSVDTTGSGLPDARAFRK